jgi:DNA-binding transcriptional ArsR family regulator
MSPKRPSRAPAIQKANVRRPRPQKTKAATSAAPVFAALGDETRLSLVARLSGGEPRSIAELTYGTRLTRQAITKHLRVLESAGIVRGAHSGRENRFHLDPRPIEEMKQYLDSVSRQWDQTLGRLKSFVEKSAPEPDGKINPP